MGFGFCTSAGVTHAMRLAILGVATLGPAAQAQLVPSVGAASAPAVDPMARAQRQADNVMRWIKVHSDKPRAAPAAPPRPTAQAKPATPAPIAATEASPAAQPISPPAAQPVAAVEPAPAPPEPVFAPPPAAAPEAVAKAPEPPPEEEEVPLKALAQAQPFFPRNVLVSLSAGKVMVKFTVEANGNVSNAEVLSSSSKQLNKPTLTAVSSWRFEPIKVPRVAQVEFDFAP